MNNNCNMDESGADLYRQVNGQHAATHCPLYREEGGGGHDRPLTQHAVKSLYKLSSLNIKMIGS